MEVIYRGTELKINVNIQPIGTMTMDNYDFEIEFSTPYAYKAVKVAKDAMVRVDESNYIAIVDSKELGQGEIKSVLTAYIPDGDMPDRVRTEVCSEQTGIVIAPR